MNSRTEAIVQYRKKGEIGPFRFVTCTAGEGGQPTVNNFRTTNAKALMDVQNFVIKNLEPADLMSLPMDESLWWTSAQQFEYMEEAVIFHPSEGQALYQMNVDSS